MLLYNSIKFRNNYFKKSESLWQYYSDELNSITIYSESFKIKAEMAGSTPAAGNTNDVETTVSLK